jgi:hypothetical protein
MRFSKKEVEFGVKGLIVVVLVAAATTARAQYFLPVSVGASGGFSVGHGPVAELSQGEVFANWNIPLKTESESGWYLQTKLNLSAGALGGYGQEAVVGTLGPGLALGRHGFPLWLEGGAGPTLISHYRFGPVDFGQDLQFTSYVGVNLDLTRHWRVGYRFQHMSNAGLASSNPGVNLNMFALSYAF